MSARTKKSIAQSLNNAQLAIVNSLADAEIKAAVAEFGYTPARLREGLALYEAALAAVNAQKAARSDQKIATAEVQAVYLTARSAYQAAAKVARATLDDGGLATLGLTGNTPRDVAGLTQAGYTLFDNAARNELLADYGYTASRLASERAKLEALDAAQQTQQRAKGNAQQATQDRDAALADLNEWVAQYLKIARVALADRKSLLEKLGVSARGGRW
jgi:hypothetical protein